MSGPGDGSQAGFGPEDELQALAELVSCEGLAAVAGWTARWAAAAAGAEAALAWVPHGTLPLFVCAGADGEGASKALRRSVPRGGGVLELLARDRETLALGPEEIEGSPDPWIQALPAGVATCLAIPLEAGGQLVAVLALVYRREFDVDASLEGVGAFLGSAIPALDRSLRADRKSAGMLHAIERLTNLFDLTKAFSSTIDLGELVGLVARKAVDFGGAEIASLWLLEGDDGEVVLSATAVNENYEVEKAPEAVGAGVVGDVLAEREPVRLNGLSEDDPAGASDGGYRVRSLLAIPLLEDDVPLGALVLANRRGRHPEFSAADQELIVDLSRQAVRALRNARLYEAEKKVEELDALLSVSREITSTLDLDRVMKTVVNASSALVAYDRCTLGILRGGKLRTGAVSGMAEVNRDDEAVRRTEALLEWVFWSGQDVVSVTRQDDGTIVADRPETVEKFRSFFAESGSRFFHGALLKDEEGKLGILAYESDQPFRFDVETLDMLQILVNQATVAIRNAQLYQQVPLAGFWKPLLGTRKRLAAIPRQKTLLAAGGLAGALVVLAVVPWRERLQGTARVLPSAKRTVTAPVDGFVAQVLRREGDQVEAGEVLFTLRDDAFKAELARAQSDFDIAESELARLRSEGNAARSYQALSRRDEASARLEEARRRLSFTRVVAPLRGVVLTPRLEEKAGQHVSGGEEVCSLADVSSVQVEVAIPEADAALVEKGQRLSVKVNSFPTRTFPGTVSRIGASVHQEGEERFVVVESRVANPDGALKSGMLGRAKVTTGKRSLLAVLLRGPARYAWARLWPLLP